MAPDRGAQPESSSKQSRKRRRKPTSTHIPTSTGASLISRYHALEKRLHQTTDPLLRKQIEREQAALGGLETYQAWSVKGADKLKGGETSKWLVKALFELEGRQEVRICIRAH